MFKDKEILSKDPEILQLKREHKELDLLWPGFNIDEYKDLEDYKRKLRKRIETARTHPELIDEPRIKWPDFLKIPD